MFIAKVDCITINNASWVVGKEGVRIIDLWRDYAAHLFRVKVGMEDGSMVTVLCSGNLVAMKTND